MSNPKLLYFFISIILNCYYVNRGLSQGPQVIVSDDLHGFSLIAPYAMEYEMDTLQTNEKIPYQVYSTSYVTELDTIYLRVDIWTQSLPVLTDQDSMDEVLIETYDMVGERLRAENVYHEKSSRNGWPAILGRLSLRNKKQARILLIRREQEYYLLTALANPNSITHPVINRFIHSFRFD